MSVSSARQAFLQNNQPSPGRRSSVMAASAAPPAKRSRTAPAYSTGIEVDEEYSAPCCWRPPQASLIRKFRLLGSIVIRFLHQSEREDICRRLHLTCAQVKPATFDIPSDIETCATSVPPAHCLVSRSTIDCLYYAALIAVGARRIPANLATLRKVLLKACEENPQLLGQAGFDGDGSVLSDLLRASAAPAEPVVLLALAFVVERDVFIFDASQERWLLFPTTVNIRPDSNEERGALYLAVEDGHVRALIKWDARCTMRPEAEPTRTDQAGVLRLDTSLFEDAAVEEELAQASSRAELYPALTDALAAAVSETDPLIYDEQQQELFEKYVSPHSLINVRPFLELRDACRTIAQAGEERSVDFRQLLNGLSTRVATSMEQLAAVSLRINALVRKDDARTLRLENRMSAVHNELDNLAPIPKVSTVPTLKSQVVRVTGQQELDLAIRHKHGKDTSNKVYVKRVSTVTRHLMHGLFNPDEECFYTWANCAAQLTYIKISDAVKDDFTDFVLNCFNVDPTSKEDEPRCRLVKRHMESTLSSFFNEARRPPIAGLAAKLTAFKRTVVVRDAELQRAQLAAGRRSISPSNSC